MSIWGELGVGATAAGPDGVSGNNIADVTEAGSSPDREFSACELRALVEAGADWIWETDSHLRFSWLSDNYEEVTGISPEAVLGRFRFDFLKRGLRGSASAEAHLADLEARRPFRDFVYEMNGARPDCRWVSITGHPRFDGDGAFAGYRGVARNVTPVITAVEGLEQERGKDRQDPGDEPHARLEISDLERTLDSLRMGVVLLDGTFTAQIINNAFYEIWKVTPEQVAVGSHFRALMDINRHNGIYGVPDDEWEPYVASRLAEIANGNVAPREFVRRDGSTMIYSVTALSGGKRLVCYYDITDMKKREAELAEALERAKLAEAVIDGVRDPIFVKDSELRFVIANRAFSRMFGLTPAEMAGKSDHDFFADDVADGFARAEREVLATGETFEFEEDSTFSGYDRTRIVRKDRVRTASGRDYVSGFLFDVTEIKRREREAEEARAHLAGVLESLPAAVLVYDRDDNFVYANSKLYETAPELSPKWQIGCTLRDSLEYGYDHGFYRYIGDPEIDALFGVDRDRWLNAVVRHYGRRHFEFERLSPNGSWHQVVNMRIDDGTFVGVRIDITGIKDREEALRASMKEVDLLRHMLDELPVMAFIKGEDLRIEYVNKAWTTLTGLSREDCVGRTDGEIFNLLEADAFNRDDIAVLHDGAEIETEEPLTHRDGTVRQMITRKSRLVAADGGLHLVGSATDISELKDRENRLNESLRENEVFRSLIDNVPVAIYAKRPDLRLFYVNKGWSHLTGFSAEDAIGRTDAEIFGLDGEAFMDGDRAVLETMQTQERAETVIGSDGLLRHQIARKGALAATDGSLYLIGSTTDITELKQREQELEEAQRKAVLADRAKSEFLANMSHEIRTPMNGVLGMAELLARSELNAKQKMFTDIIVKSGNALLTIINDILDFSKIDAGQLVLDSAPFNLAEAIEDVATLVSTRAKEKDLEMIVRVEPACQQMFVGDVGRVRQIVTNLLGNAVKFTEKGHVLVEVTGEQKGGATRLKVAVTDTGIGIPADKLKLVFEKFSQVDASSTRRHEGTGLGLAITSRLVELMNGEIGVESVEGQGSTFWFTVTLENAGEPEGRRPPPLDVTGARILVVDDNAVNRAILGEQMQSWSFDSCAAESGIEGIRVLEAAATYGVPVDCVVLDYQMPGMTGSDVARIIRSTVGIADTPIVMLTSVDQSLSNTGYRELGIDAHLIKPARSSALLDALVTSIQKHRAATGGVAPQRVRDIIAELPKASAEQAVPIGNAPTEHLPAEERSATPDEHRVDILVAEDNEVNQLVFTQILTETPYTFQIAANGRLAVKAFGEMNPRMILMDVSMPEMNGMEAAATIRDIEGGASRVPIVGVTAHALKGDRERCLESGMDDYLPKPISPRALLEKVEKWVGRSDMRQRSAG